MEKIVFADAFTKTFKKVLSVPRIVIDDPIFRLHYKFTGLSLVFACILVSGYQFFGNPIMCIQRDDVPEKLLNTYCWIEGTFTLPKALDKKVGIEVVHPGVDKYVFGDSAIEHAYYQWVCFVLFLQAIMFALPHLIWKAFESGRMKCLIQNLADPLLTANDQKPSYDGLANYFQAKDIIGNSQDVTNEKKSKKNIDVEKLKLQYSHQHYAFKFLFCEMLNLINVLGQLFFINKFLGGYFISYGIDVIHYANEDQENRVDPMIRMFPRITKCTFHKYGSSGDVQKHDALCLLPLNIINEKIFVIMWFWFIILAFLTLFLIIYRLIIMASTRVRINLLCFVSSLVDKNDAKALVKNFSYGDWFILYLLADNISSMYFREFVSKLKKQYNSGTKVSIKPLDDVDKGHTSEVEKKPLLTNGQQ